MLFLGPMVRAILSGRKTQTRRPLAVQPPSPEHVLSILWATTDRKERRFIGSGFRHWAHPQGAPSPSAHIRVPVVGDRLWVRETWQMNHVDYTHSKIPEQRPVIGGEPVELCYRANGTEKEQFIKGDYKTPWRWRPSIFMPRWASRLTLGITGVRVERLQDLSAADAIAEGSQEPALADIVGGRLSEPEAIFALWEHQYGKGSVKQNPWVWAISFEVIR